jgi:hypothetical protein
VGVLGRTGRGGNSEGHWTYGEPAKTVVECVGGSGAAIRERRDHASHGFAFGTVEFDDGEENRRFGCHGVT